MNKQNVTAYIYNIDDTEEEALSVDMGISQPYKVGERICIGDEDEPSWEVVKVIWHKDEQIVFVRTNVINHI